MGEPVHQGLQALGSDPVVDVAPFLAHRDQARTLEGSQVLGYRWQVIGAPFA